MLEDYCNLREWRYARFDGATSRAKREYLVNQFNADPSPYFLFLMSTKSGGMGLNLQSADTCILFDSDWNPQNDLQAQARVHRIGQKKKVHTYRLISSHTVEERMIERAQKKLFLDKTVIRNSYMTNSLENDSSIGGLSIKDMLKDIKFGCQAIFGINTKFDLPSLEEIDQITNRDRTENERTGRLVGGTESSAASFDAKKKFTSTQIFGGTDFQKIRKEQEKKTWWEYTKNLERDWAFMAWSWNYKRDETQGEK